MQIATTIKADDFHYHHLSQGCLQPVLIVFHPVARLHNIPFLLSSVALDSSSPWCHANSPSQISLTHQNISATYLHHQNTCFCLLPFPEASHTQSREHLGAQVSSGSPSQAVFPLSVHVSPRQSKLPDASYIPASTATKPF